MAATLSKVLRGKYGVRNIEVRKGDEVKIMRGKFKKKTGKVGAVDLKRTAVSIDGIEKLKKDGSKSAVKFHPSKVMIMSLNLDDQKRMKRIKKVDDKVEKKADVKGEKKVEDKAGKEKSEKGTEEKKSDKNTEKKNVHKKK